MVKTNLAQGLFRISAVLYARNNSVHISTKQIIRKIVEDVLFNKVNERYCSLSELLTLVKKEHNILLSDDEVLDIVKDKKYENDFLLKKDEDVVCISLSQRRIDVLNRQFESKNLYDFIYDFIRENKLGETYIDVFNRFFYSVFTTNLEGYKRLLRGENIVEEADVNFSDDEKNIINQFLSWENKEKDCAIFNLANYALEYCMLVNKKDSFVDVKNLKNKRLYLDTNILFRAMGVNGDDRRIRTEQFLSKFQQVNQQLYITKETDVEFKNTLNYYLEKLSNSFKPSCRVDPRVYLETVDIDGFYKSYCNWRLGKQNNSVEDYKIYLYAEYSKIIDKFFIQKDFVRPYEIEAKNEIIRKYSEQIYNKNNDKSYSAAEIDAKNILWVEEKRKGDNNNLYSVKDYFISSDQTLRRWDYNRNINDVPIVMMPSQWLSLILRYMERTENDYKSFASFLNIKVSNQQLSEEQMFAIINGISEVTSNLEQQKYLIKSYVENDFDNSLKDLKEDKLEERSREFAKTKLEQEIETLGEQNIEKDNDIKRLNNNILEKDKEADGYKKQLKEKEVEIENKDRIILELQLAKWKRPRCWLFGILLCFSIIIFILYFVFTDWDYNFCYRFLKWVDSPDCQTQKSIAKFAWFFAHALCSLFSFSALIVLYLIEKEEDKKGWLWKSIKFISVIKGMF